MAASPADSTCAVSGANKHHYQGAPAKLGELATFEPRIGVRLSEECREFVPSSALGPARSMACGIHVRYLQSLSRWPTACWLGLVSKGEQASRLVYPSRKSARSRIA